MKVVLVLTVLASSLLFGYGDKIDVDTDEFPQAESHILFISKREVTANTKSLSTKTTEKLLEAVKHRASDGDSFNGLADEIISAVRWELLRGPWDPADIEGYEIAFEFRPLLITYSGTLSLSIGRIQDLSTLSRSGDAILTWSFPANTVTVSIPLSFSHIIASYNFLMRVRGDTVEGVLYAWVDDINANYSVTIDMDTKAVISGHVDLNLGSLEVDLQSASISRTYRDLMTELTTDLMHEVVYEHADNIVGDLLNSAVLAVVVDM